MKILIVEDDSKAADFIDHLVRDHFAEHEICGKARSVKEASKLYHILKPDAMVMDINLGDHTSFDLFEYIDSTQLNVIFTSSYDEFALNAIKVDAVDYLLKPINLSDFSRAIRKIEKRISNQTVENARLHWYVDNSNKAIFNEQKMMVFESGMMVPVSLADVIKIKAEGSYSKVYTSDGKVHTASKGIGVMEKVLKLHDFSRIHDSCIVNLNHTYKYIPGIKAFVVMSDNSTETVSKRKKRFFLDVYYRKG